MYVSRKKGKDRKKDKKKEKKKHKSKVFLALSPSLFFPNLPLSHLLLTFPPTSLCCPHYPPPHPPLVSSSCFSCDVPSSFPLSPFSYI